MQYEKQVKASSDALAKLTPPQHDRTALRCLDSPLMRNTLEAAHYRQAVANKMLLCAGVTVGSNSGAKGAVGVKHSAKGLSCDMAGLIVRDSTLTAPPGASPAARAPSPPARGAPMALGPAAVAVGSAPAARAASCGAERPAQRASGAGRKAQAVEDQAANALLF